MCLRSYLHVLEGATTDDATRKAAALIEYQKQITAAVARRGIYNHFEYKLGVTEEVKTDVLLCEITLYKMLNLFSV
jgi:hypothetical protein